MSERYREHEQARRDFWAAVYVAAISHNINEVKMANIALQEYDKQFPKPIAAENYLEQEALNKAR